MSATPEPAQAPIVSASGYPPISATGKTLVLHEWTGSGPAYMHVHRSDDEAWHVLEGSLRFRLSNGEIDAPAGTTVFVPAGVAHTYVTLEPSRYLIDLPHPATRSPHLKAARTARSIRNSGDAR